MRARLAEYGYRLIEKPIVRLLGENHVMSGIEFDDGSVLAVDAGLISMGSLRHNSYLDKLDLATDGNDLVTDAEGRTSHPRIFALGDLKQGLNQVAIAVADGAKTATAIWREIRRASPPRKWAERLPEVG